jgi:hypothetical protein
VQPKIGALASRDKTGPAFACQADWGFGIAIAAALPGNRE